MPRYAVIDVGTNSDLLLIAEPTGSSWDFLLDVTAITRMGQGLTQTGQIGDEALQRNVDCLRRYRKLCDDHHVEQIAAVGTSALRDARNSQEVLARIADESGIHIEIIDGETEARLSYLAVRHDSGLELPGEGMVGVIDIGGGSAQLNLGRKTLEAAKSANVGAVRMTETYLKSDPVSEDDYHSMAERIHAEVTELISRVTSLEGLPSSLALAGVGGTLVNLAYVNRGGGDFSKVHGTGLSLQEIEAQIQQYRELDLDHRRQIPGLEPARADVILAGATIAREILRCLRQTSLRVSTRGLRYGLLYERFGAHAPIGKD
ncbi:MAG: Ppx/GppA family phosphatase [Armatimonadetes bacterium]|nr:Ppx/GppA family phosphatase [Armatimonadota bacterium]